MEYSVRDLIIYPVKGMAGINVTSAVCEERGFQFDRRYLVVDKNGKFCSQREHPKMALIKTTIENDKLVMTYLNQSFSISWGAHELNKIDVQVWDHAFSSYKVSPAASQWISDTLEGDFDLVYMATDVLRKKSLAIAPHSVLLSYADGYPYLIIGTASLDNLNDQLSDAINHNRFRANIIISTNIPHEEDNWTDIKIGDVDFKVIKPCARCNVITIDQQSGLKGKEPLLTLSKYRKEGNKVKFGANTICISHGKTITVGDIIKH